MQRMRKNFLAAGSGITLAAMLVLHTSLVRAEEGAETMVSAGMPASSQESAVQAPIAAQGMRVYRDPETGQLGPPPPGVQPPGLSVAEQRMLNRSDGGLQARTLPRGGVAVDLQGRYQNMAVANVGADGQAEVSCELTPAQAEAALRSDQQIRTGPTD
jgi:hypothetical protein